MIDFHFKNFQTNCSEKKTDLDEKTRRHAPTAPPPSPAPFPPPPLVSASVHNSNIGHSFLSMHGLRLNEYGVGKLALNFAKRIRFILNSGSAKQKLKEVHSKVNSFLRSSDSPRSDTPETIYALSHYLNQESIKCKKDLAFYTSKNSMSMSNSSANENTNVEGKSKNESRMQDESKKCENFVDYSFSVQKHHSNIIIMAHSLWNKFDMLTNSVAEYLTSEINLTTHFRMLHII